jgi:hypothetical protein
MCGAGESNSKSIVKKMSASKCVDYLSFPVTSFLINVLVSKVSRYKPWGQIWKQKAHNIFIVRLWAGDVTLLIKGKESFLNFHNTFLYFTSNYKVHFDPIANAGTCLKLRTNQWFFMYFWFLGKEKANTFYSEQSFLKFTEKLGCISIWQNTGTYLKRRKMQPFSKFLQIS